MDILAINRSIKCDTVSPTLLVANEFPDFLKVVSCAGSYKLSHCSIYDTRKVRTVSNLSSRSNRDACLSKRLFLSDKPYHTLKLHEIVYHNVVQSGNQTTKELRDRVSKSIFGVVDTE